MKKLSIITITYNSESTVRNTIESVISQDRDLFEYIIVDGDSCDRTKEIINEYKDYIDIFISEPDNGISDAFNKGIGLAKGEFIGIINSDDYYLPGALKKVCENIKSDTDVLFGNGVRCYSNNEFKAWYSNPDINALNYGMSMVHPSVFVKREKYYDFGCFNEKYKCVMDRELLLRFLKKGAHFQYLNDFLSVYSMGGCSDKNYFKYVVYEDGLIDIQNGASRCEAFIRKIKRIIVYLLVRCRNKMGLNNVEHSLQDVLQKVKGDNP